MVRKKGEPDFRYTSFFQKAISFAARENNFRGGGNGAAATHLDDENYDDELADTNRPTKPMRQASHTKSKAIGITMFIKAWGHDGSALSTQTSGKERSFNFEGNTKVDR